MTRLENDSRLTAYALGELDGAELVEIEAILAADSAARAAVASIRSAADRLSASLAVEPTPALDDFRRADLTAAIRAPRDGKRVFAQQALILATTSEHSAKLTIPRRILRRWWFTTSAAAAAVALAGTGFLLRGGFAISSKASELAANAQPSSQPESLWYLQFHNDSTVGTFVAPSGPDTDDDLRVAKSDAAHETTAAEPDRRAIAETVRATKVEQLFASAEELRRQERFSEAAEAMRQVLYMDAGNAQAQNLLDIFDQGATLFEQRQVSREYDRQFTRNLLPAEEASIPWTPDILYPRNWPELSAQAAGVDRLSAERAPGNAPGIFVQNAAADGGMAQFGVADPSMQAEVQLQEGRYLVYGRADRFTPPDDARQAQNRFDFSDQVNLSYGYQMPYGRRGQLGQGLNVRDALKADAGGYFRAGGESYPQYYYAGVPLHLDNSELGLPSNQSPVQSLGYAVQPELSGDGGPEGFYGPKAVSPSVGQSTVVLKLAGLSSTDVQSIIQDLTKSRDTSRYLTLSEFGEHAEDGIRDMAFGIPFTDMDPTSIASFLSLPDFRNAPQIDIRNPEADDGLAEYPQLTHEQLSRSVFWNALEQVHDERQLLQIADSLRQNGISDNEAYGLWLISERVAGLSAEKYGPVHHNPFLLSTSNPLSTFSIDVDTASYANVRRFLLSGQLPPAAAVRIEELLNYFTYDYPIPGASAELAADGSDGDQDGGRDVRTPLDSADSPQVGSADVPSASSPPPFSANMEVASCPWEPKHRLVRIGLRGWEPAEEDRPTANLVFLVDVSGSMQPENRLPLVIQSLKLLVERLREDDRIAIAVYAGASGLALPSTPIRDRATITAALDNLRAGGSTNGGEGINLAYNLAADNFITNGINRVILCTDGDFNVGIADRDELQTLIEAKAKSGVFLSVLGFGMGNLKDATLETLADRGNGNYAYIDSLDEARKVLVDQMASTLQTIAKDVKIQVEFNPAAVGAYRLLGYENRMLAAQDFNDDTKDAGEIGAGHTVTALYEIVPVGQTIPSDMEMASGSNPAMFSRDTQGSASGRDAITRGYARTGVDSGQLPRAGAHHGGSATWGSEFAESLNDVVPPPPTPIDLETETPEILVQDPAIDPLKYQTPDQLIAAQSGGPLELLTLKLRYKAPDSDESRKLEFALDDSAPAFDDASADFRFAAAVAGFAMNLRGTPHISAWPLAAIAETALTAMGADPDRHRGEFLALVKQAQALRAAE